MRKLATLAVAGLVGVGALGVTPALAGSSKPATAPAAQSSGSSTDLRGIGLTAGNRLVRFETNRPQARTIGQVSGLVRDNRLVGIDFRVQNGKLYGVGDKGGIYVLNADNARASLVSRLSVRLRGDAFGVDFNPAANRLRVVSNTGQNLRHNIDDPAGTDEPGTTTRDGDLTYPATSTTPEVTATGITAVAYTNNDADVNTNVTLYGIDTNLDQVVIQSPANAGLVQATGKLTVDAALQAGFDIYSVVRNGSTSTVRAFATLNVNGGYRLFKINLFTGKASAVGSFGLPVMDIAFPLNQR